MKNHFCLDHHRRADAGLLQQSMDTIECDENNNDNRNNKEFFDQLVKTSLHTRA